MSLSGGLWADGARWTYTPANGETPATLTDGVWTLQASVMDASARTLAIGTNNCGSVLLAKVGTASEIDLRGGVQDAAGASWTIVRLYGTAFKGKGGIPVASVVTPGTLGERGFAGQIFKENYGVTRIVIDEPEMTGIIANNVFMMVPAADVRLKAPKVTSLGGGGALSAAFLKNTDVTDWDLSGVRYFVDGAAFWNWSPTASTTSPTASIFRNRAFRGVLRLPSLVDPPPCSFANCPNMVGLELGSSNLLTKVGADIATNCASLVRVVLGGAEGWTLGARAFQSPNITNVVFCGIAPTFAAPFEIAFGTAETPARTMLFEIPRQDVSWTDVAQAARPATSAERAAFAARYGEDRLAALVGIVYPNVFKTAECQYLAWHANAARTYTVTLELDAQHPEHAVTVTPQKAAYAAGETVTITPAAGQEVFYWWGNVPAALRRAPSLTLAIDRNVKLRPLFRNRWTVTLAGEAAAETPATISDGVWTLNAKVLDPVARTLALGNGREGGAYADGNAGTGLLNLLGTFTEASGTAWTVTSLGVSKTFGGAGPTDFYAPETVVWSDQPLNRCTTMATFALVSTNAVGVIGNNNFVGTWYGDRYHKMLLAAPGLTGLGFYACDSQFLKATDVSEWDLSGLQGIGVNYPLSDTDGGSFFREKSFTGVLDLPAIRRLGVNVFSNTKRLTGLKLGAAGALTRIHANAVTNSAALVSVEIAGADDLQIDERAFASPNLANVRFARRPPTYGAAEGELVFGTEETEALAMNFNIRARRRGAWAAVVQTARAATEAERARYRFRFGDDAYLVGIVPPSAFRTAQEQFLSVGGLDDPVKGLLLIVR